MLTTITQAHIVSQNHHWLWKLRKPRWQTTIPNLQKSPPQRYTEVYPVHRMIVRHEEQSMQKSVSQWVIKSVSLGSISFMMIRDRQEKQGLIRFTRAHRLELNSTWDLVIQDVSKQFTHCGLKMILVLSHFIDKLERGNNR